LKNHGQGEKNQWISKNSEKWATSRNGKPLIDAGEQDAESAWPSVGSSDCNLKKKGGSEGVARSDLEPSSPYPPSFVWVGLGPSNGLAQKRTVSFPKAIGNKRWLFLLASSARKFLFRKF